MVLGLIQARMGSTRFPGKILADLEGKTVLGRVVERLRAAPGIDMVVVATSTSAGDDAVAKWCESAGVPYFRGDEADVLDRFYQAALVYEATAIARVTADCPLLDPKVVGQLVDLFRESDCDHAGVLTGAGAAKMDKPNSFPDGLDCEIFTFAALEAAWREAKPGPQREHVTPFLWRQPARFRLARLECHSYFGDLRWTLDHPDDLELIRWIYRELKLEGPLFGWESIFEKVRAGGKVNDNKHLHNDYGELWRD